MVSIDSKICVLGITTKKIKVFHIFYNNITTFMSLTSGSNAVVASTFDDTIKNEFDSVIFYKDTSFRFACPNDEILFFLKYNEYCNFEKVVINENFLDK